MIDPQEKTRRNIQGFIDTILALQHRGEIHAALDLSREAYSAAHVRKKLFKLNSH